MRDPILYLAPVAILGSIGLLARPATLRLVLIFAALNVLILGAFILPWALDVSAGGLRDEAALIRLVDEVVPYCLLASGIWGSALLARGSSDPPRRVGQAMAALVCGAAMGLLFAPTFELVTDFASNDLHPAASYIRLTQIDAAALLLSAVFAVSGLVSLVLAGRWHRSRMAREVRPAAT